MREFYFGKSKFKLISISSGTFDFDINGHAHSSNSYEIHYCYDGCGKLYTNSENYDIKKGSVYVTGPNVWNRQTLDRSNPMSELCIYVQLVSKENDIVSNSFLSTHFWFGKSNRNLERYFKAILEIIDNRDIFSKEKQVHYASLIMTELGNMYCDNSIIPDLDTLDDRRFLIIEEAFIYEYATITLTQLAQKLHTSERQVQRILKKYYAMTFSQKKLSARLEAAYLKLKNGDSIAEAASNAGYSDTSSFIRAFKGRFGTTPSKIIDFKNQ